jgi:two-component system, cell cycle response regulator
MILGECRATRIGVADRGGLSVLNGSALATDKDLMSRKDRALLRSDAPAGIRIALGMLLAVVVAHFAHSALGFGGSWTADLFDIWIYDGVMVGCAALCIARGALIGPGRVAWLFLGFGLGCDAAGEILSSISESFAPTAQDALYLCLYLGAYVAVVLLGRRRAMHFHMSMWLDGIIGGLAVGSLGAVALSTPGFMVAHSTGVRAALDISYPLADVLLIGVVVVMLALGGWRAHRPFLVIALGFLVMATADGVYLFQEAHGTYAVGTPLDSLWLFSALILGYAAWQPDREGVYGKHSLGAIMAAPVLCGLAALGVLAYGSAAGITGVSTWLAVATLVTVLGRLVATAGENLRLIVSSGELANRDALTGLGNRRALLQDLELAVAQATASEPKLMLLFDLNGFKRYNDTFGHPAGDALLRRLSRRFAEGSGPGRRTYRLGGDEFCALLEVTDDPSTLAGDLAGRLLESSEHFTIGACYGEVLLGIETHNAEEALRIADQRLYAQKTLQHGPSSPEWRDVLLGLLRERDPELDIHAQQVADLASRLGRGLGMEAEDLRNLVAAAELHDVGKAAIPDAILEKPAELNSEERAFIERHTLIGERILSSAPSGRAVGAIVRATHEHYDGRGYPDGLSGEQIPLPARIIAICDAFQAMTSNRSYRAAMPTQRALDELRRCAGSQFDPQLTALFLRLAQEDPGSIGSGDTGATMHR